MASIKQYNKMGFTCTTLWKRRKLEILAFAELHFSWNKASYTPFTPLKHIL